MENNATFTRSGSPITWWVRGSKRSLIYSIAASWTLVSNGKVRGQIPTQQSICFSAVDSPASGTGRSMTNTSLCSTAIVGPTMFETKIAEVSEELVHGVVERDHAGSAPRFEADVLRRIRCWRRRCRPHWTVVFEYTGHHFRMVFACHLLHRRPVEVDSGYCSSASRSERCSSAE